MQTSLICVRGLKGRDWEGKTVRFVSIRPDLETEAVGRRQGWPLLSAVASLAACLMVVFSLELAPATAQTQEDPAKGNASHKISVFEMPEVQAAQVSLASLMQSGNLEQAGPLAQQLAKRYPSLPFAHYVMAILAARAGDADGAISGLERAIDAGYRDVRGLELNPAFETISSDPRFGGLVERVKGLDGSEAGEVADVAPAPVRDGVARIDEANTVWDPRLNLLQSRFKFNSRLFSDNRVDIGKDPPAELLNSWFRGGRAAGNIGDLYDNRDRNHSALSRKLLPQVAWLEYGPKAKATGLDFGLNSILFYNAPTYGNSSVGVQGLYSIARFAMSNPRDVSVMYLQYRANQIYIYPSVRDHAPFGYDAFPANIPYILVSRGKSGSDKPFMHAVANIMAAFKPEVKKHLTGSGLLMPTVQMVFRRGQTGVETAQDYLSPTTHPTVFDGERIDREKMIRLANVLEISDIPPMVTLTVLDENDVTGVPPATGPKGVLFDTPGAIARLVAKVGEEKRMTVSAAETPGVADGKTVLHWVVLEGDPAKTRIVPRSNTTGVAEIVVPWHGSRKSTATPEIETQRVDIGVFAQRGEIYSAPAFISVSNLSEKGD